MEWFLPLSETLHTARFVAPLWMAPAKGSFEEAGPLENAGAGHTILARFPQIWYRMGPGLET